MSAVRLGSRGKALIRGKETLQLVAYKPTPKDKWTIGWGHTRTTHEGMRITVERAEELFREDAASAIRAVSLLSQKMTEKGFRLTESMTDALICIAFNATSAVSTGNTIGRMLLAGRYYEAWRGFAMWTKQRGVDPKNEDNLRGLAIRRAEEMLLFLEDGIPI